MNDLANVPTRQRTGATPLGWLRAEVDRLFEDFGRPARDLIGFGSALPALDMVRTDKDYVVTAEMPGMKAEDVRITVDDQALIVAGEKRQAEERQEDGHLLSERRYGAFERRLPLPADVDPARIEAAFHDGVLTLTMGRTQDGPERSRRIEIRQD